MADSRTDSTTTAVINLAMSWGVLGKSVIIVIIHSVISHYERQMESRLPLIFNYIGTARGSLFNKD